MNFEFFKQRIFCLYIICYIYIYICIYIYIYIEDFKVNRGVTENLKL